MPSPISNQSPTVPMQAADVDASERSSPPAVTIEPVVVEGDASVQRLVNGHDAAKAAPDCSAQAVSTAVSASTILGGIGATIIGAAGGPVGLAVGLGALFKAGFDTGKDLRSYYDCKTQ